MSNTKTRCAWVTSDPIYIDYHDHEWGVPLRDDQKLFELFILECMQAGLSWITILKKRENYRAAFDQFDAEKIARYTPKKIEALMQNSGIIRNALKINAIINNAKAYLKIKKEYSSFSDYLWQFVQNQPQKNQAVSFHEIPTTTAASDAMSKDLKKRGFTFVGSTTCYAFMQAAGLVNDHSLDCFRHGE
jgi:DNA-3-methyladenine glycosylase I